MNSRETLETIKKLNLEMPQTLRDVDSFLEKWVRSFPTYKPNPSSQNKQLPKST